MIKSLLVYIVSSLVVVILGIVGFQRYAEYKTARFIQDCSARGGAIGERHPLTCILPSPYTSGPEPDNTTPAILQDELQRGWYWGFVDQKKPGTPDAWVFSDSGRNSCWHVPKTPCTNELPDVSSLCKENGGAWIGDGINECESTTLPEDFCKKNGGDFSACLSPCRHNSPLLLCADICMRVCAF